MKPSRPIGRSTSRPEHPTRHLNAFRGVRAISKFDWPFTPTLGSSGSFSTLIGSGLHPALPGLHPAPSSGSLSLRLPASSRLTSPATATRRFIMQKARRHTHMRAPTACRRMVSGSVSLPSTGCFPPFPHGTCSLSVSREYLALPDGPGGFAQGFSCPALLREPLRQHRRRVRGFHPLWPDVPVRSA